MIKSIGEIRYSFDVVGVAVSSTVVLRVELYVIGEGEINMKKIWKIRRFIL